MKIRSVGYFVASCSMLCGVWYLQVVTAALAVMIVGAAAQERQRVYTNETYV